MFSFFKKSLEKVSQGIQSAIAHLGDKPSSDSLAQLEQRLLEADLGPAATAEILDTLKSQRMGGRTPASAIKELLATRLTGIEATPGYLGRTGLQTLLILGINGAGKTTTVAKLAHQMRSTGRNPIIGSADTFRAAANDQLGLWAQRAGVPIIESRQGGDPAAVAYDAHQAARARGHDTLLIDTAGRLHTKEKLMEELGKIERALKKLDPQAPQERYLVIDGSLGLNSLAQAQAFAQAIPLTGLIITKLDGTSRAGVLVPLYQTLRLPVYFVGLGEGIDDLKSFELSSYLDGLIGA